MTSLLMWKEFGATEAPSITTAFSPYGFPGKEKVLRYLETKGKFMACSPRHGYDVITGKKATDEYFYYSDGEYSWNSMIPYYVKKYNMRLPKEFEKKAIKAV